MGERFSVRPVPRADAGGPAGVPELLRTRHCSRSALVAGFLGLHLRAVITLARQRNWISTRSAGPGCVPASSGRAAGSTAGFTERHPGRDTRNVGASARGEDSVPGRRAGCSGR